LPPVHRPVVRSLAVSCPSPALCFAANAFAILINAVIATPVLASLRADTRARRRDAMTHNRSK
jgi:hypothetical protein